MKHKLIIISKIITLALLVLGIFFTLQYQIHMKKIQAQSCFTYQQMKSEADSQTRCLYAYKGQVWDMRPGGSFKLHHGQACAEDVYCTVRSLHFNGNISERIMDTAKYFKPSYIVGTVCPGENIPRPLQETNSSRGPNDPNDPLCNSGNNPPPPTNTPIPSQPTNTPAPTQPAPTTTPMPTSTLAPTSPPSPHPMPGDANGDGKIDLTDYQVIVGQFASTTQAADFNRNGVVDVYDVGVTVARLPQATPPTTAPTNPPPTTSQPSPTTPPSAPTPTTPPSAPTPTRPPSAPTPTAPPSGNANFSPFGSATVSPDFVLDKQGGGDVDTIAFWEAPNPTDSIMFVTNKGGSWVEYAKYPFNANPGKITQCIDDATNAVWVDQETDKLYTITRNSGKVCVFSLPDMSPIFDFTTPATHGEPNFAMLNHSNGRKMLYITDNSPIYIYDPDTGIQLSGAFQTGSSVETAFADNKKQVVYVPDEKGATGVYVVDPEGKPIEKFGSGGIFGTDEEGIWLYTCPSNGQGDNGDGLIFVTEQAGTTEFEVFNRNGYQHLGKLIISGVGGTDGIAITQQASPAYPMGVFAAIHSDLNTVGVGMDKILSATGLSCGN